MGEQTKPGRTAANGKPSLRDRLASHERPGAVRRGPPITVWCPCGSRHELGYGEVGECQCGRRWNTGQIDFDQYCRLRRVQLRFRVLPVVLGMATSLIALFFLLSHNTFSLMVLLPTVLLGWGMVLRPIHRRRYARALGQLPRWQLRPEPALAHE